MYAFVTADGRCWRKPPEMAYSFYLLVAKMGDNLFPLEELTGKWLTAKRLQGRAPLAVL